MDWVNVGQDKIRSKDVVNTVRKFSFRFEVFTAVAMKKGVF
jgi:hypothetical protein